MRDIWTSWLLQHERDRAMDCGAVYCARVRGQKVAGSRDSLWTCAWSMCTCTCAHAQLISVKAGCALRTLIQLTSLVTPIIDLLLISLFFFKFDAPYPMHAQRKAWAGKMVSPLVSPTWLRQQLVNGLKHIRLLDGTYRIWLYIKEWAVGLICTVDLAARGRFCHGLYLYGAMLALVYVYTSLASQPPLMRKARPKPKPFSLFALEGAGSRDYIYICTCTS